MKLSVLNLLQIASLASAHYTFPALIFNGQTTSNWQYVRMTINRDSTGPVTDVSSSQMTCYTSGIPNTSTANVNAGDTVGFTVNPDIFHPGPLLFYMAKVPDGQSIGSFSGSGSVWFKIYQNDATISGGTISWPMNQRTVSVKIPSCIPSGQYLLRVEHIALHSASSVGGAQLYIACGQLNVSGGGSTPGSPTVSFPGAYSATDPGILINMYGNPRSYTPPGPAVFSCSGNNGSGGTTTARTSSTTTTTSRQVTSATTTLRTTTTSTTTTTTTSTTTNSGGTQAKWGQCGGLGWTGPTACQSGSTCVVQNSYYSQCQ